MSALGRALFDGEIARLKEERKKLNPVFKKQWTVEVPATSYEETFDDYEKAKEIFDTANECWVPLLWERIA